MIIVTGGAGFIGSNVVAALEAAGVKDVVVIDWLGNGDKWRNIAKRELAAIVRPEDIFRFLDEHVQEIEAIIHMGAISSTTETDADMIVHSNFMLSWELWRYCRDNRKRFIFASSAATYGDGTNGFDDRDDLEYLNALRPLNAYGWSKALMDRKVARERMEERGTPTQFVALKFFNVYSPNEYHKGGRKSVVAHLFPLVTADSETQIFKSYNPAYADGEQMRDFVWVGDVADIVVWMLKHPSVSGLFNVGTGKARTFWDLAAATWRACGKEPHIGFKEMPTELREKYQYFTEAQIGKLRAVGYTMPMPPLEEGIRKYVQEFLVQPDPYR
jgi:ADP-L-glycero-D-manno-heptose 6-epimerase